MLTVFFDETCGICMRTKAFLEKIKNDDCEFSTASKMNFDNTLPSMKDRYLDLQSYDGNYFYSGYETYIQIFKRYKNLYYIIYLILIFWPVKYIGKKIYKRISNSRSCEINYDSFK